MNNLAPGATAQEQYSLGAIVAVTDQVDAAVTDIVDAWTNFIHGSNPPPPQADKSPVSDRLQATGGKLSFNANRLQELAGEIRRRS